MKFTIGSIILTTAAMFLAGAPVAPSQDTIVYVNGPSFPFQYAVEPADAAIDLNQDGVPDFSFQLGYFIRRSGPYYAWGLGTNSTLFQQFSNGSFLPFGTFVGDPPLTNAVWGDPEVSVTIAILFIGTPSQSRLYGPLADAGVGYMG